MLGIGSAPLFPRNEPMPFPQPIKTYSLGKRLEMLPGGRGAGTKMSITQVSASSEGVSLALGSHLPTAQSEDGIPSARRSSLT